jgi:GT2 family glycosyltransferase
VGKINNSSGYGGVEANSRPPQGSPLASLHMPGMVRRLVPNSARSALRALRVRILMRDFRRYEEVEQSPEDAQASEFISIIVPIHDAPAVTRRCLASLERYAPKAEVVLVDDGSRLVQTADISQSSNLQALAVASHLRQHWNDNQICEFAMRLKAESVEPIVVDLAWASGFAFFVRRDVWEQLGGFDPNLPDYGNEKELCNRVAARGYRRVWVRNAYIHHLGRQSYGESIGEEAILDRKRSSTIYIEEKTRDGAI